MNDGGRNGWIGKSHTAKLARPVSLGEDRKSATEPRSCPDAGGIMGAGDFRAIYGDGKHVADHDA